MFQRFEIEKTIYIHPTFFGLWEENSVFLAKFILQGQLVSHVLKDVGLVVSVPQVLMTRSGNFDPSEGGLYATVRFICYAFAPVGSQIVPGTILKGVVSHIDESGLTIGASGFPDVRITKESLRPGTVYNGDKNCFIWTKVVEKEAKYFEIKLGDHIRYQIDDILYGPGPHPIVPFDPKSETPFMHITGNIRTYSLGPVHWYTTAAADKSPNDAGSWIETLSAMKSDEPDFHTFLEKIKAETSMKQPQ